MLNRLRVALDARSGVGATAQTLFTNILILGFNFGTGVITARALGAEGRGELAAMVMWPQFAAYLVTLGLPSSLLYNLKRQPADARALFWMAVSIAALLGAIAGGVGAALLPRWLSAYSPAVVHAAQILMAFAPISLILVVQTAALQAREDFVVYNIARASVPLIALLLLGAAIITTKLTPINSAMIVVFAGVPTAIWLLFWFRRRYSLPSTVAGSARPLLSYGARAYGSDLLQALLGQIDRVIVVTIFDPSLMGLYVVAASLAQTLMAFPTAAASVLFAKTAGRSPNEVVPLAGKALRVSIAMTALIAGVAAILGPFALELVYGAEFAGAALVFRILLADVLLRGACWILAQTFLATGRPGLVSAFQGAALVLRVPLLLVLARTHGANGAALALVASTAAQLAITLVAFPVALKHRPPGFLLRWSDLPPAWRGATTPTS